MFPPSQPSTVELAVTSEPPGAQAKLSTGQSCAATPCVIKAPADAEKYLVTFSLKGHLDQSAEATWLASGGPGEGGNFQRQLVPNPVYVELETAPPPPPQAKRKPAPKAKPKPAAAQ